jgi:hypothetical protein
MRARGGKVASDSSVGGTKVEHTDQMPVVKKNMNRGPVITKAAGGSISSEKGKMGPKYKGGTMTGYTRKAQAAHYKNKG